MITFFTTPKPFRGLLAVTQGNALQSWKLLHPDAEVIVFGEEAGAADACRELGLRHEPGIQRNEHGTPYLNALFERAQDLAKHDLLCFLNCDILLAEDFRDAVSAAASAYPRFLMVGRRWDLDVTEPLDFSQPVWEQEIVERTKQAGFQRLYYNIDYFAFRRHLYRDFPELVIGRNWWDQWLVWRAWALGAPVVDASGVVCAVHQNHDYAYHPQGVYGVWYGQGSLRNMQAAGGRWRLHTIEDANYLLTPQGIDRNRFYWMAPAKRVVREHIASIRRFFRLRFWFPLLDATRHARHAMGLKNKALPVSSLENSEERLHPYDRSWSPAVKWDRDVHE